MPALLLWLGQFLLRTVASELFKKAAIFLTFNIVMSFMLSFLAANSFGLSIFGVGDTVAQLLGQLGNSTAMYVVVNAGVVQALFLVLNAYLARFAYRLVFRALGR
jgi:hypothetical protein